MIMELKNIRTEQVKLLQHPLQPEFNRAIVDDQ
jgi:hypothetical protein